jgi:hypothetical protein
VGVLTVVVAGLAALALLALALTVWAIWRVETDYAAALARLEREALADRAARRTATAPAPRSPGASGGGPSAPVP